MDEVGFRYPWMLKGGRIVRLQVMPVQDTIFLLPGKWKPCLVEKVKSLIHQRVSEFSEKSILLGNTFLNK